ncbi:MAG: type II toxin-antitoxin system VapC family toxin [Chloroflexi bacterium]|nr:type II toxin-antitoxin system VapC family toxin [Chloroflexota bacterium]
MPNVGRVPMSEVIDGQATDRNLVRALRLMCYVHARAVEVVEAIGLVPVDRALLIAAGALTEPALRALDAIHIASAADVSPLDGFVTYDERQAAAARLVGLRTVSPGA